jgi:hypothetical protein
MDISNKTLAVLLVLAIIVSVGGAMINITKLSELARVVPAISMITGFGTTGEVNVSVLTLASLNLTQDKVDFGVGYVSTGYTGAELNSSNYTIPASWTESGNTFNPMDLQIENIGTVDIFVNVSSDKTAQQFIGGNSPDFRFSAQNEESNSCVDKLANETSITTTSPYEVCKNLTKFTASNLINVSIIIFVPEDAIPENKTATLTFSAVQRS